MSRPFSHYLLPPTTASSSAEWRRRGSAGVPHRCSLARHPSKHRKSDVLLTPQALKTTTSLATPASCGCQPSAHYYSRYEFEVAQRVPKVIMGRGQHSLALLFWIAGFSQEMKLRTGSSYKPQASAGGALCHPASQAASETPGWVGGGRMHLQSNTCARNPKSESLLLAPMAEKLGFQTQGQD